MRTFLAQNQFISNPSVIRPRTERSAVASKPPPAADAAAAPFAGSVEQSTRDNLDGPTPLLRSSEILGSGASSDSPSNERRPSEASAPAPTQNPDADALDLTDCISEIFFYARKLMKQPPRFVLDQARFLAEIEETPLFLREDGYLQRREA